MQHRLGVRVGAVVLGFAGLLGVGSAVASAETADAVASAETAETGIQASPFSGTFYVYEHDDFKGGSGSFRGSDRTLTNDSWENGPAGRIMNDNISSMRNQTDRDIFLWEHAGFGGDHYLAKKHSEDKDLTHNSNNPPNFDNRASSIQFR